MAGNDAVIGVDGGGTKTVAVVADALGHETGRAIGPGANLQTVGEATVRERLSTLFAELARGIGHPVTVRAVTVALAGVDRPDDVPVAIRAINDAIIAVAASYPDVTWRLTAGAPSVTNDAVAALAAGARTLNGVVVIAGTGSIAFGIRDGQRARAGGWGSILGDEGSGYALGYEALRAVARAHDGRADATRLTEAILSQLGAAVPPDLIGIVSSPAWGVAETAGLAPIVVRVAESGDPVALAIIEHAAAELSMAAVAVIDALGFEPTHPLAVVQAGGLWPASATLRQAFAHRLNARAPFAVPAMSEVEPVHGAVWLARRDANLFSEDAP